MFTFLILGLKLPYILFFFRIKFDFTWIGAMNKIYIFPRYTMTFQWNNISYYESDPAEPTIYVPLGKGK